MTEDPHKGARVRIAPSPTGPFHFGVARTALFNWLFARQHKGSFIVRIEDTDIERSDTKYEFDILEGLRWLGLDWDEGPSEKAGVRAKGTFGPYRQSERKKIYRRYLEKLLREKKAYYCYCTKEDLEAERQAMVAQGLPPKYSGHCRELQKPPQNRAPEVIRFKTPEIKVVLKDMIRGTVSFDAGLFGDIVIAKDEESPLYNFAAVVDDHEMQISHVIRGEDHLPNTPKQILIQRALGFKEPAYAHLPLILGQDKKKLSKRYTELSLLMYREKGYMPEAIVNFLVLLGWHPKSDQELFTTDELIDVFEIKRVQKSGAVFNEEKLDWINAQHIRNLGDDEIANRLIALAKENGFVTEHIFSDKRVLKKIVKIEKERLKTLRDFFELTSFFFELPEYNAELLVWQKESQEKARNVLQKVRAAIQSANTKERFTREDIARALHDLIEEEGGGAVLWPLRVAVSGRAASPDPLDIMEILGFDESVRRIIIALKKLSDEA